MPIVKQSRLPRIFKRSRKKITRSELEEIQEIVDRSWDDEKAREARKQFRVLPGGRGK